MAKTAKPNLAPVCPAARKMASKELRRAATDADVRRIFKGCEYRIIPRRLAVLDALINEAWCLYHRLIDSGITFAGTPEQATMTIAGTAYAAWRSSLERDSGEEPAAQAAVVSGLADGLEFAFFHADGIPWMYAADYADAIAGSDDPIDRMKPLDALARVWPDRYSRTTIRFTPPKFVTEPTGWAADFWEQTTNVLTAAPATLRQATKPRKKTR